MGQTPFRESNTTGRRKPPAEIKHNGIKKE
jgi:hypothetical protein